MTLCDINVKTSQTIWENLCSTKMAYILFCIYHKMEDRHDTKNGNTWSDHVATLRRDPPNECDFPKYILITQSDRLIRFSVHNAMQSIDTWTSALIHVQWDVFLFRLSLARSLRYCYRLCLGICQCAILESKWHTKMSFLSSWLLLNLIKVNLVSSLKFAENDLISKHFQIKSYGNQNCLHGRSKSILCANKSEQMRQWGKKWANKWVSANIVR